jgi:GNAT superfamily N-acetyltransferase
VGRSYEGSRIYPFGQLTLPEPQLVYDHCAVEILHSLSGAGAHGVVPNRHARPFQDEHVKPAAMLDAAKYSAIELLRDGRRIEIRALRPDDRVDMLAALARLSAQSLYRRFHGAKRDFSEKEKAFFFNVDFVNHVALIAAIEEGRSTGIVGGARYVVLQPGIAEVAFAVVDEFQGKGIGAHLMRHLTLLARSAGLKEMVAEVLSGNAAMLKVFSQSGLGLVTKRDGGALHVRLHIS